MHFLKFLALSAIAILLNSCGGGNAATSHLFAIQLQSNQNNFQSNQTIGISLRNKKQKVIDKITYSIDGQELPTNDNTLTLDISKLGNKTLIATVDYEGNSAEVSKKIKVLAANPPEIYTYEIINEYPHDIQAYTQGLEFYNDTLYESTGKKGRSSLRKINFRTGEVLNKIELDKTLFGEGITILDNKIYQLTWQSGTGFIYDLNSFKKTDSFKYNKSKEGWGLCTDGKKLYKSDGTEKIWILNPESLVEEGYIETVTNKSIFNKANELEYVDGKIYANVYQKESMMIIDSGSGAIEGVINFGGLKAKVTKHGNLDVLNGVAYHPSRKTFFVTGKNWDKLFEIKIKKKP